MLGATRGGLAPAKEGVGKNPERYKLVEAGTIFYNPMRILLGSIALLDEGQPPGITSPDYVVFRTRPGIVHPRWFYYWLRSEDGGAFIRTLARGAVRERMLFRRLAEAEIEVAPYPSQLWFAWAIELVERARGAVEAQLEAAKTFKRACFRAAFAGDATRNWDRVRLGDLALSIQNGVYKAAPYYGHGKPLLRMYNLQRDSWLLDLKRLALAELNAAERATYQVMTGDLLVSRVNSFELVGKCSLVDQLSAGFAFENMLIRIRLHERVDPLFIVQQMSTNHIRQQIEGVAKRAIGQASINSDDIRQLRLLLPPLSAQRQIAADLAQRTSAADGLKRRFEMECEVIAKLPGALLRRAFSGEL
jgi:hypothetical protein